MNKLYHYKIIEIDHKDLLTQKEVSRIAICNLLQEKKINADPSKLSIYNHHYFVDYPEIVVSLAHCPTHVAAVIANKEDIFSIGIDIENSQRKISKDVIKRIANPFDQNIDLTSNSLMLSLWTKKEAAFKALFPVKNLFDCDFLKVLSHIWVCNDTFGIMDKKIIGQIHSVTNEQNIVSIAFIKSPKV